MTPKWVSVTTDNHGHLIVIDDAGRMFCRGPGRTWDQYEPPPPLPEPSTDWRRLVERAVRNARPNPGHDAVRWGCVKSIFGVGSTRAQDLCREFGLDPDDVLRTMPEEE